ncbi:carbohydrate ABC transporter membrane protein 2 (CUT1 family) [Melghirimyces profundicolus]|uniref:Carbohydrate ABC transporter membrane protein 2 (CUT1 family) n=1 Tax=Melghirimyces profundicolus TaxID=1242148 RepID=A0A2T6C0R6_9BACL|nr:carbohydrate ABC transporter permease [Melghirimyces profundicolus]PTX61827.1 carbohydrate ABC transporter membrane protein 2 (CUT1 family) [Melghirimyces profundicolus]
MNRRKTPPVRYRRWLKTIAMYLLLMLMACLFIGPFILLLSTAFKSDAQAAFGFPPELVPHPPVWDNFDQAWNDIPFPRYLFNSFFLVAVMVPTHLFLAAITAYPLARMKFFGRNFIFYAIIATMFIPDEVILIPRFLIVKTLGMTDSYLGIIVPGLIGAFSVFLMRQAYLTIPKEMEEAAIIDGCGPFRLWWNIMLPLTAPTMAALGVFSFISVWNSFIWPLVVLKSPELYPLSLGLAYLAGIFGTDVKALAAGAMISVTP